MKVLIVEDDEQVADALDFTISQHGHETTRVATATEALAVFRSAQLILLDLGLPDLDGHELCRRLRAGTNAPIITVTGRDDEVDRVMALHYGADDYVVKPFSRRELMARIYAVTRRVGRTAELTAEQPQEHETASLLRLGDLSVDTRTRRVTMQGTEVALTRKEFDLLALLMLEAGTVRTREEIIAKVWDENWYGSTRTLDVHVGSLRSKLGDARWIETVRGIGYRVELPQAQGVAK